MAWKVSISNAAISWEKENAGNCEVLIATCVRESYDSHTAQPYRIVAFLPQITIIFYYSLVWLPPLTFIAYGVAQFCFLDSQMGIYHRMLAELWEACLWSLMCLGSIWQKVSYLRLFHSAVEHLSSYRQALSSCFSYCLNASSRPSTLLGVHFFPKTLFHHLSIRHCGVSAHKLMNDSPR